ncbi:MAG: hypothetical protein ACI4V7_03015 [Succinivibrionaceae bacterium]
MNEVPKYQVLDIELLYGFIPNLYKKFFENNDNSEISQLLYNMPSLMLHLSEYASKVQSSVGKNTSSVYDSVYIGNGTDGNTIKLVEPDYQKEANSIYDNIEVIQESNSHSLKWNKINLKAKLKQLLINKKRESVVFSFADYVKSLFIAFSKEKSTLKCVNVFHNILDKYNRINKDFYTLQKSNLFIDLDTEIDFVPNGDFTHTLYSRFD